MQETADRHLNIVTVNVWQLKSHGFPSAVGGDQNWVKRGRNVFFKWLYTYTWSCWLPFYNGTFLVSPAVTMWTKSSRFSSCLFQCWQMWTDVAAALCAVFFLFSQFNVDTLTGKSKAAGRKKINSNWVLVFVFCMWVWDKERVIKGNGGSLKSQSDNWTNGNNEKTIRLYLRPSVALFCVCVSICFWLRVCAYCWV